MLGLLLQIAPYFRPHNIVPDIRPTSCPDHDAALFAQGVIAFQMQAFAAQFSMRTLVLAHERVSGASREGVKQYWHDSFQHVSTQRCHDARGMAQSKAEHYFSSLSMALSGVDCSQYFFNSTGLKGTIENKRRMVMAEPSLLTEEYPRRRSDGLCHRPGIR